jgi:hypothetical protein
MHMAKNKVSSVAIMFAVLFLHIDLKADSYALNNSSNTKTTLNMCKKMAKEVISSIKKLSVKSIKVLSKNAAFINIILSSMISMKLILLEKRIKDNLTDIWGIIDIIIRHQLKDFWQLHVDNVIFLDSEKFISKTLNEKANCSNSDIGRTYNETAATFY